MKTKEKSKPFYWAVLNKNEIKINAEESVKDYFWEPWTGRFETLFDAECWFDEYGQFHADRGHIIGLFKNENRFDCMNDEFIPEEAPDKFDWEKYNSYYQELRG